MKCNKLLTARKNAAVFFDSASDLAGLTPDEIAAAKANATAAGQDGKYMIAIINTTQQPVLMSLTNRASREKVFKASWYRAEKGDEGDTRETLEKMAKLRLQKAKLMGKKSFAEWKLQDQMAQTPAPAMPRPRPALTRAGGAARSAAAQPVRAARTAWAGSRLRPAPALPPGP